MNKILYSLSLLLFAYSSILAQKNSPVPEGEVRGPFVWKSNIYPGTERNYWVHVPQQYDASKPAALMVVQDGIGRAEGWNLIPVLDSLIALKEIPVMISVFIDHGIAPAAGKDNYPRYNRSFEYDARGDRYARFLLEEILPELGKSYNISTDPNDRSIAGASSGAIAAFNVAWERPDQFRRVLSTIGSYVGLRGAEEFPKLIRVTEPKPIRVFLEDGSNDLDIYAGGWWTANQSMFAALNWAGYELKHNWGEGGHNSDHAREILPEALVWLWKDYPEPVRAHPETAPRRLKSVLAGETWQEVPIRTEGAEKLAVNETGQIYFTKQNSVYTTDSLGNVTLFTTLKGKAGGMSFYKGDRLYVADMENSKIMSVDKNGEQITAVNSVDADFLIATDKGIYFSDSKMQRIGFHSFSTDRLKYYPVKGNPSGLVVSAEQTFLNVGVSNSLFGYSFKIDIDGSLTAEQEYIHFHKPYGDPFPQTQGLTVDAENVVYSATALGIQVSDQLGRINFILSPVPGTTIDVKLAGSNFDTLFLTSSGKLFRRKINAKGVLSWLSPITPPKPGL